MQVGQKLDNIMLIQTKMSESVAVLCNEIKHVKEDVSDIKSSFAKDEIRINKELNDLETSIEKTEKKVDRLGYVVSGITFLVTSIWAYFNKKIFGL